MKCDIRKFSFEIVDIILILLMFINCGSERPDPLSEIASQIKKNFSTQSAPFFQNFMQGTKYETRVYCCHGKKPAPAVIIIGGTHGDEPAGFEAAYRLLNYFWTNPPIKGTIFIIPEANKLSIVLGERRIPVPESIESEAGNLNRCYPGRPTGLPMQRLAFEIAEFAKNQNIKLLIDLHESPYFYQELQSENGEYPGLGQSIIYTPNEQGIRLGHLVCDKINQKIPSGKNQFTLKQGPIKNSATWFAGEYLMIPGFTIETCKKLLLEERIQYHIELTLSLLNELGIFQEDE